MGSSRTGSRALIVLLSIAVIGLSIALFMVGRSPEEQVAPAPERPAPAPEARGSGFARAPAPSLANAGGPPARAFNELGQPLDENGRPIGPPQKLARLRNRAIAEGELPVTPPRFTDAAQRAEFKEWWVDEFARRVAIFEQLEPREGGYPDPAETEALLDSFYDASEPRAPDEPVEQAIERRRQWRDMHRQFLDTYGVPPYTIITRAGDPQYGEPTPPPFQPPGAGTGAAPPAEPATEAPPGRSTDEPGGTEPLDRAGEPGAEPRDRAGEPGAEASDAPTRE